MKVLLTGCAGFIGSNLLDYFLAQNSTIVVGIDNLSTGRKEHISSHLKNSNFTFYELDLKNKDALLNLNLLNFDIIIHLAANADVRFGLLHPSKDLEENTIATFNLLEFARINKIKKFAFSSTGSIYGESKIIPTPENTSFPIQTSLYGASKLACEGLIQAYAEGFGIQAYIFRFVSILGPRYTHGHVIDFYKQLIVDQTELKILGDGNQRKSYLHVEDCIRAIVTIIDKANLKVNIFNLGVDDTCTVKQSANWVIKTLGLSPKLNFLGGTRGWIGDNPLIHLSIEKLKALGWENQFSIEESIKSTIDYLISNRWIIND